MGEPRGVSRDIDTRPTLPSSSLVRVDTLADQRSSRRPSGRPPLSSRPAQAARPARADARPARDVRPARKDRPIFTERTPRR